MVRLLEGHGSLRGFIDLQAQSEQFYRALEATVDSLRGNPAVGAVAVPGLERKERLAKDLEVLLAGAAKPSILPETEEYVAELTRIKEEGDVAALIAHHYVRYLGDLAGGQVIARLVQTHYGAPVDGLTFYDFSELGKVKPFRDRYRQALDSLQGGTEMMDAIVENAQQAFEYNRRVFEGLAGRNNTPAND